MKMGACFPGFFHSTRSSPTNRPSRFFSPTSKKVEEYPFTPTIKSTNWRGDVTRLPITMPITPTDSPSPRMTSNQTYIELSGEVEGLFIHRPHISAGLPSFFQRPFHSTTSEFSFTPKRKPTVAEISPDNSSSPIGFASSSGTPFRTPTRFTAKSLLHTTNRSSEQLCVLKQQQLPIKTQDQQFQDESGASAGANDSVHSAIYRFQLNEIVDCAKPYLDDSERKSNLDWINESSFQSDQEKTSFEREVRSFTEKVLAAAANTESNSKAENTSLKRELSKSQQQICHLEAQFDELKKNQSEAILILNRYTHGASDLSREKKTLHSHIRNLQEQVSAVEEQLEQKQGQCEMVNLPLEDTVQLLKDVLERISTQEELLRSSVELLSALQTQLQQVLSEREAMEEKASKFQEDNEVLRSQLYSLREKCNDSEEKIQLDLFKVQQVLDCEIAAHTETKMSAVKMLSDTKNALECQVNELQENFVVVERKKELVKQELDSERSAHSETKSDLELCKNLLEEDRNRHLLELSKVQDTVNILKDEKNQLKSEIDEFRGNLIAAFSQNESIMKELDDERKAHNEIMSYWKSCEDQLVNEKHQHSVELSKIQNAMKVLSDQNKFIEAEVNELKGNIGEAELQNKSIKQELDCEIKAHQEAKSNWKLANETKDEEIKQLKNLLKFFQSQHLDYDRQLNFSALEISKSYLVTQQLKKEKIELEKKLQEGAFPDAEIAVLQDVLPTKDKEVSYRDQAVSSVRSVADMTDEEEWMLSRKVKRHNPLIQKSKNEHLRHFSRLSKNRSKKNEDHNGPSTSKIARYDYI